jgi:hypothetical protein
MTFITRAVTILLVACVMNGTLFAQTGLDVPDLSHFSRKQLLACFHDYKICGAADGSASGWQISDELARRPGHEELYSLFWRERSWEIRDGIEHVAYHFDDDTSADFMRRVFRVNQDDGEDLYYPVNYMAKRCDEAALHRLATERFSISSLQLASSVELFGKCKYRPAIPFLVDSAINAASLNLVEAAQDSLKLLYPDSPKDFDELGPMQRYYCGRARKEGFHVNCNE